MNNHALISPSASSRVLKCPASLLASLFAPRTTNEAAERGTELHAQAETILTGYVNGNDIPDDVNELIQVYVQECVRLINVGDWFMIEARLPMDLLSPIAGQFGTADFVAACDGVLYIIDLKTGRGEVSPFHNSQLSHYGIGAYELRPLGIHTVMLGIAQGDVIEYETISADKLLERASYYHERYKLALSHNAPYELGDHCKYCQAKATCPKQRDALYQSQPAVTVDEMVKVFANKKSYISYIDAVEEKLTDLALDGNPAPGTKLAPGISRRVWRDDKAVIDWLIANTNSITVKQFIKPAGIGELTKIFPELEEMTVKPETKMVLKVAK